MEEGLDPDEARRQFLGVIAKEAVHHLLVKTPNTFHYDHDQYPNFEGEELNHKIKTGVADVQNLFEVRSLKDYIHGPPPLGLKLQKTPSAVKLINEELDKRCGTKKESQPKANKFAAVHFPASSLSIGDFNIVATYPLDLVAGCYYATRKLVWEILDKQTLIMNRIVVSWDNILAIQADIGENRPGILEIELHKEPMFYQESDSEPRSHRAWKLTEDFTGGEGSTCRRHYLEFPPGVLKEHYEKMIQYDERLRELSQRPFPSLESPNFGGDLLYQRDTDNPHSHAYAVLGSNNNPDRHHQQPAALVSFTQQPQQFGSTIPSSLVYSTAPTSDIGSAYIFNNGILEDQNMANIIQEQECDDHANIWAMNSMLWASEGQQSGNFSNLVDMCLKDSDFDQKHGWKSAVPLSCHVAEINSSSTSAGLSMKVNPDFNSNYTTSTQIADLPTNTRINSMEAFTCEREHYNFLNNGIMNDTVLSHQGRFKRQALHFPPLQAVNYLLPHTLNADVTLDCSTRHQDHHDFDG